MRALPRRAVLAAPAAALMFALVACGGSDSGSDASSAADTQQSAQSAGGAQAAGEETALLHRQARNRRYTCHLVSRIWRTLRTTRSG
ncbi:hypothetical protein SAMN05444521_3809 [Streptomyces sp. 3214.6]|nr:hypothetical protein SAMN05444521_3809 [Streptomyces sp. 3214.6]